MKPSRSSWSAAACALVCALVCALALAGCSSANDAGDGREAASSTLGPDGSAEPSTEPADADPAEVVAAIEVRPDDLPPGYGPDVMQKGDEVDGQVTLDMCDGSFPSEGLRTARHQVYYQFGDPAASTYDPLSDAATVSSESVAYSPGGAEQAMQEVREAVASCPQGYVDSTMDGIPPSRTSFTEIPSAPGWQDDHVAGVVHVRFRTGESLRMAIVYQRRGDLLAMTYVLTKKGGRGTGIATDVASLLSSRLDAVSDPIGSNPTA